MLFLYNLIHNIDRIVNVSTRRYSDEETDRVFCYFEDGMNTVKISKLLAFCMSTISVSIFGDC